MVAPDKKSQRGAILTPYQKLSPDSLAEDVSLDADESLHMLIWTQCPKEILDQRLHMLIWKQCPKEILDQDNALKML